MRWVTVAALIGAFTAQGFAEILVRDDFEGQELQEFLPFGEKFATQCYLDHQAQGLCSVPEPWTWWRSTLCGSGHCSSTIGDVSGSKAWTYWMQSRPTTTWGNDGLLSWWSGGPSYPEMWVQFDARFDPNWEMTPTTQFKIFRIFDYIGCCGESAFGQCDPQESCTQPSNIKKDWADCPPYIFTGVKCNMGGFFLDPKGMSEMRIAARCVNSENCCGKPSWSRPGGCGSANGRDVSVGRFDKKGNWADGDWHRWKFQIVMNQSGKSNGVVRFWIDDRLVLEEKRIPFQDRGPRTSKGFDSFHLGGNTSRHKISEEHWYAFDNVCAATAEADLAGCFSDSASAESATPVKPDAATLSTDPPPRRPSAEPRIESRSPADAPESPGGS